MQSRNYMFGLMVAALMMCLASAASAAVYVWTDGSGDHRYVNPANWVIQGTATTGFPTATDTVQGPTTNTALTMIVDANPPNEHGAMRMGENSTATLTINITTGTLNAGNSTGSSSILGWRRSGITINQTGGVANFGQNANGTSLGEGAFGFGIRSTYNLSGPWSFLSQGRGNFQIPAHQLTNNYVTTGTLIVSNGGNFQVRENKTVNGDPMCLSVGNTRATASGYLAILGSGAMRRWVGRTSNAFTTSTNAVATTTGGNFRVRPNGILEVGIDANGITPIEVFDSHAGNNPSNPADGTAGNVCFDAGSRLKITALPGANPANLGPYTVLRWEGQLTTNSLTLHPASTEGWKMQFSGKELRVMPTGPNSARYWEMMQ